MHFTFYLRKTLVSVACLCAVAPAVAQDSEIGQLETLSPQALVTAVLSQNHHLQALGAVVEAAQLRIEPAGARADPMLSFTLWPNSIGSSIGTRQGGQISQSFRWPGTRELKESVAGQHAGMAFHDREAARLNVVTAAKNGFAEWHFIHRAIEINAANQALLLELIRVVETRYAAGQALQQDVLQAEVEHVKLRQQRLTLDQQRRSVQANINELLNREPDRVLPPPVQLTEPSELPSIENARTASETVHPEVLRLEAALAAHRSTVALEDRSSLPDFNAYLGYSDAWDEVDKRLQLGVSVNLPLGRNKRRAERDAARADFRRAEHELQGQRTTLLAALEVAYAEVQEADLAIQLYHQWLLPLAQDTLDASLADYQSGTGQFINVITAERQKLTTELGLERAVADYWRRRAELERVAGADL